MRKHFLLLCFLTSLSLLSFGQTGKKPAPLKVGYSLGINKITPEKMAYAKSVGIEYIEVSFAHFIDPEKRTFKSSDTEVLETLRQAKKATEDAGIKIWAVHMPYGKNIDISLPDESEREEVLELHSKVLEYCKVLEPEIILFHPSWYLGLNERELRKSQMIKSAVTLQKKVKALGATMVIENMLGFELRVDSQRERPLCRSVEETVEIMNRLPRDIYSAVDMNHIKYPEKLIRALGSRVKSVHIADGTGKQENHLLPCSGKGENNWNEILRALNEVGYKGAFIYESAFKDEKELKDCYDFLYYSAFDAYAAKQTSEDAAETALSSRIFPLLSSFHNNKEVKRALEGDQRFRDIKTTYISRVSKALQHCPELICLADSLNWKEKEISIIGDALIAHSQSGSMKKQMALLRQSGAYALFEDEPDSSFIRLSWKQNAAGINRIFDVYLKGTPPRYNKIDSISFKSNDPEFRNAVIEQLQRLMEENQAAFFSLSLKAAIRTLMINGRDEAARFVPLTEGMNKKPIIKVSKIDWSKYKYSMILVPGLGPEPFCVKLDPGGIERCKSAAERYRKGLAPFIVVSGGNVHPFRTPYNEAVEMKNYMVEQLGIPEEVILIEPHARHTTTNLRNVSRIIYRFGVPAEKPVLIVTDKSQNAYIVGKMAATANRDLGYLPYKGVKKLSDQETELYPDWNSMHTDAFDPLDP